MEGGIAPLEALEKSNASAEPLFALDIGTRSVIGIVGIADDEVFRILDMESVEHTRRAMIDGQIEDIEQVARIAGQVKANLEQRLGLALHKVHIAAAGRALKTVRTELETTLQSGVAITQTLVSELEEEAVAKALGLLMQSTEGDMGLDFYCVGYSVIRYSLDSYPISTLVGHKGKAVNVEIIATFLPGQVVDSLYAVMSRIGLQVASLTLEPIAAINAVIPEELRILNLALADIGAGTSDIAISKEGSVVAYTMATVAGDEITEALIRKYLVDFETAERVKMQLREIVNPADPIRFSNILGIEENIPAGELREAVQPALENLCAEISNRILSVNESAPAAVFLVGGGSKMPGVAEQVAAGLGLDVNKVAVGGNNYLKRFVSFAGQQKPEALTNPEYVTPIGIALTAARLKREGLRMKINGKDAQVLKSGIVTVMDALSAGGFDSGMLMGRSGKSVTFELNGSKRIIRGGHPTPAEIKVNGKPAGIVTPISDGDVVEVAPAVQGEDAKPLIRDAAGEIRRIPVALCGREITAGTRVYLNGAEAVSESQLLHDFDRLLVYEVSTVGELLSEAGFDLQGKTAFKNGRPADAGDMLEDGDMVTLETASQNDSVPAPVEPSVLESEPVLRPLGNEAVNDVSSGFESVASPEPEIMQESGSQLPQMLRIFLNGVPLELPPKEDGSPYLFLDMLGKVDIDLSKPQGIPVLQINGMEASFLAQIGNGDAVEIRWKRP